MQITQRTSGDVTILDLNGKLVIGDPSVEFRKAVHDALDAGNNDLLVNMAGVTYMDSSGVGELVSSYSTATNRGARLKLSGVSGKIEELLTITRLITVFETYGNEEDAVASFG